MSGEHLRRSSWKADAIRRGDLKISGPLPITEDMPLNEEEEKAYEESQRKVEGPPSTAPPTVVAFPRPKEHQSQDGGQHELAPLNVPPNIPKDDAIPLNVVESIEVRPQTSEGRRQPQQNRLTVGTRGDMDDAQRRSATEPALYSTPSPYPSVVNSSTRTTPKKRKSGLRNAFRKMFGRKGRGESIEEDDEGETRSRSHNHHISDPGLLRASSERRPVRRGPRISDLPVQEPTPINPLGSHLPFPMNVNAPQEASPPHEYLTFEIPTPDLGRRRATLPGILPDAETQSLDERVQKRLSTWEERLEDGVIPSPEIGIALSSPPAHSTHSIRSKRRSRSAGALREMAKAQAPQERRRSAEIRYWRNSYASGSIYSENTPRPRTAQTVDTVMSTNTKDTNVKPPTAITEDTEIDAVSTDKTETVPQHFQDLSLIQLSVEAFNFGNLRSGFSDDEDSEQPTAAHSNAQSQAHTRSHSRPHSRPRSGERQRRLSIDDRVKILEEGMRTLETSVNRFSGQRNRQTIILDNAPKGRRNSRNRSESGASERQGRHHSSSRSRSRASSLGLSLRQGETEGNEPVSPTLAPLSAVHEVDTTVKKGGGEGGKEPTAAHYAAVLAHLKHIESSLSHERHSRKKLETQVTSLQCELMNLHALVSKLLRSTPSRSDQYPTPSPEFMNTRSSATIEGHEERIATPRASRSEFKAAAGEDSGIAGMSGYESEPSSKEDDTSPEAWATPSEELSTKSEFVFQGRGEADMF
ncbi:hypothetical protein P280DRAFT_514748 [Massarina eburnea CBS 473.64]|uniref:Uncharacterized protein n=1 Tax=Massarina eburnea CBS 473.64 TaxID=1395130 RepID=A0A6A6SBF1_9PLEO|nr:hypothetical protein P280DRAFT_514748 [Massarina eburnea CBS 473.64]